MHSTQTKRATAISFNLDERAKAFFENRKTFFHDSRQVWLDFGRGNHKYIIEKEN